MKTILSSRRRHYAARVSIFLVMVALIAGMVGCGGGGGGESYTLTIASTDGGAVTTPGVGTFTYNAGTVVSLNATPDAGYHFVNWTGNVGTIGNVNAAATNITVNGDYFITAKFAVEPQYILIIASTEGGEVTEPGEGVFSYDEGAVVNLVAEAEEGYRFIEWTGGVGAIADVDDATTTITMDGDYFITAKFAQYTPMVAAGSAHTVGLKADGTVVAVGANYSGQCNVGGWASITQVAAGLYHTVGVKNDGTVVAVGDNEYGKCNVDGWTDIIQVAAGYYHTVGLKADGTVVAVGYNGSGQCNVGSWTNITQVAASYAHTVGLMSDGTVVAVGDNSSGQCNVGGWTNITQVAASYAHTVGLRSDGTVVAVGANWFGQCDVGSWTGITQVAAGAEHTVGLKFDGTVVAVGSNGNGQCNVSSWMLK
jgi:hypothetical protein